MFQIVYSLLSDASLQGPHVDTYAWRNYIPLKFTMYLPDTMDNTCSEQVFACGLLTIHNALPHNNGWKIIIRILDVYTWNSCSINIAIARKYWILIASSSFRYSLSADVRTFWSQSCSSRCLRLYVLICNIDTEAFECIRPFIIWYIPTPCRFQAEHGKSPFRYCLAWGYDDTK